MRKRNAKEKLKNLLFGMILVVLMVLGSIEEPLPADVEEIEDIIHWKDAEVIEEEVVESETELIRWKEEVSIEEVEFEVVTEPKKEVAFYNVPLSEEIQLHIFEECEKHNIAPSIVIALIEFESYYDEYDVSPSGAKGLMQVMSKWHQGRMDRLGCTDLFNPYQNITVGIDYLAELKAQNKDLYWVLMAYNQGIDKATQRINNEDYSKYALGIVERASELQREVDE